MLNKQYIIYAIQILTVSVVSFFIFKIYNDNIHMQHELYYIKSLLMRLQNTNDDIEQMNEDNEDDLQEDNMILSNDDEDDYNITDELDNVFQRFSFNLESIPEQDDEKEESKIEELPEEQPQQTTMIMEDRTIQEQQEQQEPEEEIIQQEQKEEKKATKVRRRKNTKNSN